MGAGHTHGAPSAEVGISRAARLVSIGLLALVAMATVFGIVYLWPGDRVDLTQTIYGGTSSTAPIVPGRIMDVEPCPDADPSAGQMAQHACAVATVSLTGGPDTGKSEPVELIGVSAMSGLRAGDTVWVTNVDDGTGQLAYALVTADRLLALGIFALVFILVVIAVAGWKGVRALLALVLSGVIFFGWVLPALGSGRPAVAVALTGASAIMFAVLYLAHGVSMRTTSAFVGTLVSLVVTAGLGALGVWLARLSGLTTEENLGLASVAEGLNFSQLLTASLIIAGLGVLNDTTITQASAIWELRAVGPHLSRWELFGSGMRIGRDHIASTIYTIVFAYAGAALSTLVLLSFFSQPLNLLLSTEPFAEEIVRTLGSGIGLVLSVPLTTAVAALTVGGADPHGHEAWPQEQRTSVPRRAAG